jgi:hypothetical protein
MAPGNVYKGIIDANSAILSPFGEFYVYPNSPFGMSVLVDDAFNFISPISGLVQQATASPAVVTLVAPTGTNPYLACIYWNSNNNSYGAPAATPALQLPDYVSQIPLAAVEISPGQTTVTAANMIDLRGSLLLRRYARYNLTNLSLPQNLYCDDCDIYIDLSAAATMAFVGVKTHAAAAGIAGNANVRGVRDAAGRSDREL